MMGEATDGLRRSLLWLLLGAVAVGALIVAALQPSERDAYTSAAVAEMLEHHPYSGAFLIIKRHFPEDYAAFLEDYADKLNRGASPEDMEGYGYAFTSSLRRSNAHYISGASDPTISESLRVTLDLTRALSADPALCADFSIRGGAALLGREEARAQIDLLLEQTEATFAVIAEGRAAGEAPPEEPTDADWAAFSEHWMAEGAGEAEFEALTAQDAAHPEMCRASLWFIEAVLGMPGDSGARLRRFLVRTAAEG